jgi:hypothetical protein
MAGAANLDAKLGLRGARLKRVPAGTVHRGGLVGGMDSLFHAIITSGPEAVFGSAAAD